MTTEKQKKRRRKQIIKDTITNKLVWLIMSLEEWNENNYTIQQNDEKLFKNVDKLILIFERMRKQNANTNI